jgi:hypothetical protein
MDTSLIGGDGLYAFYSLAIDGAGNNESAPAGNDTWTTVDNEAPLLEITEPAGAAILSTTDVQVSWTVEDTAGIESFKWSLDGGIGIGTGGSITSITIQDVADGNHWIEVNATDKAGHSTVVESIFTVDTVSPVVSIASPLNNSALRSVSIQLEWVASDNGSGLKTVEVSMDGISWVSVDVDIAQHTFYGPSGIADGTYELSVRATDMGGLVTIASVVTTLDDTNPTVTVTYPRQSDELTTADVTVGWVTVDTGSGIQSVKVSIDGGAFETVSSGTSWTWEKLENGPHEVTIKVTDRAGNSAEASVVFTVSAEGGISAVVIAGIAVILVVAVVAGVLLMRKKKGPAPSTKAPEKK